MNPVNEPETDVRDESALPTVTDSRLAVMKVDSRKTFRHGFILNEAELRRIAELARDQLLKLRPDLEMIPHYEIRFRNGAVAESSSIEEVLALENSGSGKILTLDCLYRVGKTKEEEQENVIYLTFNDVDDENSPSFSMRYIVKAPSRDWVFVTCSMLEERVAKIKRNAPKPLMLLRNDLSRLFLLSLVVSVAIVPILAVSLGKPDVAKLLRLGKESGAISDPIDALIVLEESRSNAFGQSPLSAFIPLGLVITLFGFLVLLSAFVESYYPLYNFLWGDYVDDFERSEGRRKLIMNGVFLGIVVSFIGGLLVIVAQKYWG